MSFEQLWGIKEAASFLKVSTRTVRRLAEDGRMPSLLIGKLRRFDPDTVREWVRAQAQGGASHGLYASILPEHHLAQANRVTYGLSHNPLTAGVPKGWGTAASRKEAGVFETLEGEMQTQFGRTSSGTEDGGVAKRGRYRPPHVVSLRWPVVIGAVESFWGRIGPGSLHTSDTGGGA